MKGLVKLSLKEVLIKTLLVFFFIVIQSVQADVHLIVKGEYSHGNTAGVYSCLAYRGCGLTTFSLGSENRLHIQTSKSVSEVKNDLKNCHLYKKEIKKVSLKIGDKKYEDLTPLLRDTNKNQLSPAILDTQMLFDIDVLEEIVEENSNEKMVEKLVGILNIDLDGYEIKFNANSEFAVTDHVNKTISFSNLKALDLFSAIRVIRHETDHIQQNKKIKECSMNTAFVDHELRERAAYLNDAALAEIAGYKTAPYISEIERYKVAN